MARAQGIARFGNIDVAYIDLEMGETATFHGLKDPTAFVVVKGQVTINGKPASNLCKHVHRGDVSLTASTDALILKLAMQGEGVVRFGD